jgi:hypothetical protein
MEGGRGRGRERASGRGSEVYRSREEEEGGRGRGRERASGRDSEVYRSREGEDGREGRGLGAGFGEYVRYAHILYRGISVYNIAGGGR